MINKRTAFLSAMLVLSSALPLHSSAASVELTPEISAKEASVSGFSLSAPSFRYYDSVDGGKLMPTADFSKIGENASMKKSGAALPEAYDMRTTELMTPVKDQGVHGTCWVHSAIVSAETSIAEYVPNPDISEMHTAYYTYWGDEQFASDLSASDILALGGNSQLVSNIWAQWIGPVSENRLVYDDFDFFEDDENVENMYRCCDYHLKNAYMFDYNDDRSNFDEINTLVKEFVYDGLAVDVSYQAADSIYYSDVYNSTRSVRKPRHANHSVAIVGWDDNFPKENFLVKPENDGAWLIKNSWGEDKFDNGYMWISYEDRSLCEYAVYELEDAEKYAYNYQHDTFTAFQALSAADYEDVNEPSYMANVFTADEKMQAEAISVQVPCAPMEYKITIYSGLTDKSDPVSGTPSAVTSGVVDVTGIVTLELDEAVLIEEGESFSAVVKFYSEESPYVVPIESVLYYLNETRGIEESLSAYTTSDDIKNNTQENQSFISNNLVDWIDTTDMGYRYSKAEKKEVLALLKEQLYDDIYPEETDLLSLADSAYNLYEYYSEICDLYIKIGNISLKVLGNPVKTIGFSHMTGYIPTDEQLTLCAKDGSEIYYSLNGGEYVKYAEPIDLRGYNNVSATADFETFNERSYIAADFIPEKGDVNADGSVDASDASRVLEHYSTVSTGGKGILKELISEYGDLNSDEKVDSSDASLILEIYAERSTK